MIAQLENNKIVLKQKLARLQNETHIQIENKNLE